MAVGKRIQPKRARIEEEKEENLDRWLLTYSDMITLLMLFFIILYSMSNLDVAKFKTVAQSISAALTGGNLVLFPDTSQAGSIGNEGSSITTKAPTTTIPNNQHLLYDKAMSFLQSLVEDHRVTLRSTAEGLQISILSDIGFETGSATISSDLYSVLQQVSELISNVDNDVRIDGHTDSTATDTKQFPSNWELSAARAVNVLETLVDYGVDPARLTAAAHADTRPVASNDTAEGRAYNRRVEITILDKDRFAHPIVLPDRAGRSTGSDTSVPNG